jgi:hypothetical protein
MRASALAKRPIDPMKAYRARLAVEEKLERIALLGDTPNGLVGLFNVTNAQTLVPGNAAAGTPNGGAATNWKNKTPDEILKDLNNAVSKIKTTTNGLELPDTVALPIAQDVLISTTARSPTSDTTIKEFFLRNNPGINTAQIPRLAGAGSGATDRMIVYRAQPDALQLAIPQEFEQFPPQIEGMEMSVPCHMRTGGLLVFFPLSVLYCDAI